MSNRDTRRTLFERLDASGRPGEMPARWRSRRHFDDPFAQFEAALAAVQGRALRVGTQTDALDKLAEELSRAGIREVVVNAGTAMAGVEPEGVNVHRADAYTGQPDEWRAACARAGAGITAAEALLAETGTVVVHSGTGMSRMVSLLPPVHFVICEEARLTTDIFTWLAAHGGTWPANAVLISGPSKTGDIEQTMTVGVHGPRQLIVILYRENTL